jgi:hypothetical protein
MTRGAGGETPPGAGQESVPKRMAAHYRTVAALTDEFCRRHLDEEYAALARRAVAALCRKRPSPLLSGHAESWACGVVYALGQVNFLGDKSMTPSMSMLELCAGFGVAASTGGSKAKAVRAALGIRNWDHRWLLQTHIASMPMVWLVEIDGFSVDARALPRPLQVAAHRRGIIPYVPADGPAGDGGARDAILARYDRYRAINTEHQSALARRLWTGPVARIAVRLGLIAGEREADGVQPDELAPAADLAIYGDGGDGSTAMRRYAAEIRDGLPDLERRVLDEMCLAAFSLFRVAGCHRGAGVDLVDLVSGERLWVVDRGLEASAHAGIELALRLFQSDEFWMTTGVAVVMDKGLWDDLESAGVIRRRSPTPPLDRDALAETIYRLAAC